MIACGASKCGSDGAQPEKYSLCPEKLDVHEQLTRIHSDNPLLTLSQTMYVAEGFQVETLHIEGGWGSRSMKFDSHPPFTCVLRLWGVGGK